MSKSPRRDPFPLGAAEFLGMFLVTAGNDQLALSSFIIPDRVVAGTSDKDAELAGVIWNLNSRHKPAAPCLLECSDFHHSTPSCPDLDHDARTQSATADQATAHPSLFFWKRPYHFSSLVEETADSGVDAHEAFGSSTFHFHTRTMPDAQRPSLSRAAADAE